MSKQGSYNKAIGGKFSLKMKFKQCRIAWKHIKKLNPEARFFYRVGLWRETAHLIFYPPGDLKN